MLNPVNPQAVKCAVPKKRQTDKFQVELTLPAGQGVTCYGKHNKPELIGLSREAGHYLRCYDRTIMYHEILHAKYTKVNKALTKQFGPEIVNAVSDLEVHLVFAPKENWTDKQKREMIATAGIKLRGAIQCMSQGDFNGALYHAMIPLGVFNVFGIMGKKKMFVRLNNLFSDEVSRSLRLICGLVYAKKIERACKLYRALMKQDENASFEKPEDIQQTGAAQVNIVKLPLVNSTNSNCPTISVGSQGSIIHPGSLVRAAIQGKLALIRTLPIEPQGTFLIDASGSMRPTIENLTELCSSLPGANVIYYNGAGKGANTCGDITVFAERGRRADHVPDIRYGGNSIDAKAMEYAFQYRGPYTLISDEQFHSGESGQELVAHAYAASRFKNKFRTIEQAIAHFKRG